MAPATAIEIPAATMLYSIAVAPRSSRSQRSTAVAAGLRSLASILDFMNAPRRVPSEQVHQVRDQRLVGRRHRIFAHLARPRPGELLAFARRDDPVPAAADVERHDDVKLRIGMAGERQRRETLLVDDNAQLLLELADERVLGSLARLDLAAGKLPQPGHRLSRRTLRDQHATVGIDQGAGRNEENFAHSLLRS